MLKRIQKGRPQVRLYPDDYKAIKALAELRVTPIAQIIHELLTPTSTKEVQN